MPVVMAFSESGECWLRALARKGDDVQLEIVGHSDPQHRTFFGYLQWVHAARYLEDYPEFDDWRDWLSVCVRHVRRQTIMVPDGSGGRAAMEFLRILSWSHRECPHGVFNALVTRAQDFLARETGLTIEDYLRNKKEADHEVAVAHKNNR